MPTKIGNATWNAVGAGLEHTCGIQSTKTLWCWGDDGEGQIGDGTDTPRRTPTQVGALTTWTSISVCPYHSAGIHP